MTQGKEFWKTRFKAWSALDTPARAAEGLFGLIMVLGFTGTISVSTSGRQEVGELLWAALGCNIAWGLVDAIMYLMDLVIGRARGLQQLDTIREAKDVAESRDTIRSFIPPLLSELMEDEEIDRLGDKFRKLPVLPAKHAVVFKDFLVAGQIFLVVFLITLPVALPFLFVADVALAIRISNATALALMFIAGYSLARYSGLKPIKTALAYTALGLFLVALTMVLGG
jgi:uncharacterized membrane protein